MTLLPLPLLYPPELLDWNMSSEITDSLPVMLFVAGLLFIERDFNEFEINLKCNICLRYDRNLNQMSNIIPTVEYTLI